MNKAVSLIIAILAIAALAAPVQAASPLAALTIGSSINYHVTTESNTPENGTQSASHNVAFMRTSPSTIQVSLDGAPAGNITLSGDGNVSVPPNLKNALTPFGEIALYMRGAPRPLSLNASWAATLPVPVKDQTDEVPLVFAVTQLGAGGATITGNGSNAAEVQRLVRSMPANISVTTTMHFSPVRTLSSATRTVSITVKAGRFGPEKHYGSSWTIASI